MEGPWVIVAGMHRSGTSAVTGTLAALGLAEPAPADLMKGSSDNPNHHESLSMTAVSDQVLDALGGSWSGPPLLTEGWERSPEVLALRGDALAAIATAYPDAGARVWKDPRSALLLPFWRQLLAGPLPVVFIWRAPMAVARSLQRRDGFTITHGLALWHHYNRVALTALAGAEVLVLRYEDLVAHPRPTVSRIAAWLDHVRIRPVGAHWDVDAAEASVSRQLAHEVGEGDVPAGQRQLADLMSSLGGEHPSFMPGPLPEPPQWVGDYLAERSTLAIRLSALQRSEADRQVELERIWSESCQRAEVIKRLQSDLAGREQEAARLGVELGARDREIRQLADELDDRHVEVVRLASALQHLRSTLDAVYHSRSWRLSAPLRAVGSLARSSGLIRVTSNSAA